MTIQITDHDDRIKQLLPQQFKDQINIDNILTLFAGKIQEIEDMFFQLIENRILDTAVGQQLDNLGTVLGETRNGRGDSEYRAALGIRIKINTSSGTPETMIDVMASLTNATNVRIIEQYPAEVELHSNGDTIPSDLLANMKRVAPAAVSLYLTVYGPTVPIPFSFDSPGNGLDVGEFVTGF